MSDCTQDKEPPYAEPHVRWCERSENESRKETTSFSSYSILKSMCTCSHNFTNFAVAEPLSLEVGGLCGQEPSSVSFVQRGHIRQIAWRKDFWRSFRYHFKSIAITLKFTKISSVFLYYIIDNQWLNSNYCHCFGGCYQGGFSTVLNIISWPQMAA